MVGRWVKWRNIALIQTKQIAALYRNTLSSQADIWKTLWWSATSSENYPISFTHYSHNSNSLLVAPSTVCLFFSLQQQSLESFCSINWNEWCYRALIQRLSVLDAFPLGLFWRAELTGNKLWNNRTGQSHKAVSWCVVAAVVPRCLLSISHACVWERAMWGPQQVWKGSHWLLSTPIVNYGWSIIKVSIFFFLLQKT